MTAQPFWTNEILFVDAGFQKTNYSILLRFPSGFRIFRTEVTNSWHLRPPCIPPPQSLHEFVVYR